MNSVDQQLPSAHDDGDANQNQAGPRVLIVEDDPDSQYIYRLYLEHHGFEVISALTSAEAIRLASEATPDVILMDISIPGMDGWSTTKVLKQGADTSEVPIIIITAHAFPQDHVRAADVGCDGFLSKPCELGRLKEAILEVMDAEAQTGSHA